MGDKTKIEWAEATWNPIRARHRETGKVGWFCVHASDGCAFCYAETLNRRLGTGIDYRAQDLAKVEIFLDEKMLTQPLRWRRPRRIFVGSMTDLFGEFVPDAMLDRIFAVMALCPQHTFLPLTKRAGRMRDYLSNVKRCGAQWCQRVAEIVAGDPGDSPAWPLPNVWVGVSVEDQARADERIPELLATPAAVRFVSYEPALEEIHLRKAKIDRPERDIIQTINPLRGFPAPDAFVPRIDWVICGGESGRDARPMHPAWARSVRDQCVAAGVPFFFKQWGEWASPDVSEIWNRPNIAAASNGCCWPDGTLGEGNAAQNGGLGFFPVRVGKRAAGRLLDGREWSEYPERSDG